MKKYIEDNYKEIIETTLKKLHLRDHENQYEVVWDENNEATFKISKSLECGISSLEPGDIVRQKNKGKSLILGIVLEKNLNPNGQHFVVVAYKEDFDWKGMEFSLHYLDEGIFYKVAPEVLEECSKAVSQLKTLFNSKETVETFKKLFE